MKKSIVILSLLFPLTLMAQKEVKSGIERFISSVKSDKCRLITNVERHGVNDHSDVSVHVYEFAFLSSRSNKKAKEEFERLRQVFEKGRSTADVVNFYDSTTGEQSAVWPTIPWQAFGKEHCAVGMKPYVNYRVLSYVEKADTTLRTAYALDWTNDKSLQGHIYIVHGQKPVPKKISQNSDFLGKLKSGILKDKVIEKKESWLETSERMKRQADSLRKKMEEMKQKYSGFQQSEDFERLNTKIVMMEKFSKFCADKAKNERAEKLNNSLIKNCDLGVATMSAFDELVINGPIQVEVFTGDKAQEGITPYSVTFSKNSACEIIALMKDNKLVLDYRQQNEEVPQVNVYVPRLKAITLSNVAEYKMNGWQGSENLIPLKLTLSGATHVEIEKINVGSLEVNMTDNSSAKLDGRANWVIYGCSGTSHAKAMGLMAKTVHLGVSGKSTLECYASKLLVGNAAESAKIYHAGAASPAIDCSGNASKKRIEL